MYTTHFGFAEKPFKLKSDPLAFYVNADYENAYEQMGRGILERRGLIALTGVAGTGKSLLLRLLVAGSDENAHFIVFSKSTLGFADILKQACDELISGVDAADEAVLQTYLLDFLRQQEDDNTLALAIDDAHNLDQETVDKLVQLYHAQNGTQPPLQILLVGLPELEAKLVRHSFAVRVQLKPLNATEIDKFIQPQLDKVGYQGSDLFPPQTLQRIAEYSGGVPRNITALCDAALFIASLEGKQQVSPDMIEQAAQQCFLEKGKPLMAGDALINFDVTPADVAKVMSTPHPAQDALRRSSIERVPQNLYAAQSRPWRSSQPPSAQIIPARDEWREKSAFESPQEAGFEQQQPGQAIAPVPKRSNRPRVAAALLTLLILVGAGGFGIYYKPGLVGFDRGDIDTYIARVEHYAHERAVQAQIWLDRAREQLAAWTGVPPAPEAPAPAATPSPAPAPAVAEVPAAAERTEVEPQQDVLSRPDENTALFPPSAITSDESSPPVASVPTVETSPAASAESSLSDTQPAEIESSAEPVEIAESAPTAIELDAAALSDVATAPEDTPFGVAESSQVSASEKPLLSELQPESARIVNVIGTPSEPQVTTTSPDVAGSDIPRGEQGFVQGVVEDIVLEQQLADLFARAERQIAQRHLTTPATDNALDTFLEVLALSPGNDAALNGIENIKNTYQQWAEAAARQKDWVNARFYYQKALALDPNDSALQEALAALPTA